MIIKSVKYLSSFILLYFIIVNMAIKITANEPAPQGADSMVILGAMVVGNPAIPSQTLQERLDVAIQYLQDNPQTIVIVCGGRGVDEAATEASVMKTYLLSMGIIESRIITEDKSTRTAQQFVYAQAAATKPLGKTVIVSSDFHILRSLMLARRSGLNDVAGLSAPVGDDNPDRYSSLLREPLALLNSFLFDFPAK